MIDERVYVNIFIHYIKIVNKKNKIETKKIPKMKSNKNKT